MNRIAVGMAAALCCGCAAKTKTAQNCAPVPDGIALIGQPVYRDCAVDRKARQRGTPPRLNFVPSGEQSCARVVVDVIVDAAGVPVLPTARVVRATDPAFAAAVLAGLEEMRYDPAQKDGQPVAQLVRYERAYAIRYVVAGPAGTRAASRTPSRPPC